MGIVHHPHYIVWFEIGRTEFCREAGLPYRSLEDGGLLILVTGIECAYRRPVRYDDPITVRTALPVLSSRGLEFSYEVFGEGARLGNGVSRHLFADRDGRPVRAPEEIVNRLDAFRKLGSSPS